MAGLFTIYREMQYNRLMHIFLHGFLHLLADLIVAFHCPTEETNNINILKGDMNMPINRQGMER